MIERPNYQASSLLRAADLDAGSRYLWECVRRHNRYLHGWGVVCGLLVVPARIPRLPWAVRICTGYAISPCGDEIVVCCPVTVDLRDSLWSRPVVGGIPAPLAYVALRYATDDARPIAIPGEPCNCSPPGHRYSRLRDSYRVAVLWETPQALPPFDLCAGQPAPCPPVPDPPVIPLASVQLPTSEAISITVDSILPTLAS
jgi:hypothetical protein